MIALVITGGQTDADQGGWRAAKAAGISTGGWMPKGYRTEGRVNDAGFLTADESHPEFAELYGAREHHSPDYPPRTEANVIDADGSILFGDDTSKGAKLLIRIERDVSDGFRPPPLRVRSYQSCPMTTAEWIRTFGFRILHLAGNRESSAPGIGEWVERYLSEVFQLLRATGDLGDPIASAVPSLPASPAAPPHPEDR